MELIEIKATISRLLSNYKNFKIKGNLLDRHNKKGDRQQEIICCIELVNYPFWNGTMELAKLNFVKEFRKLKAQLSDNKLNQVILKWK